MQETCLSYRIKLELTFRIKKVVKKIGTVGHPVQLQQQPACNTFQTAGNQLNLVIQLVFNQMPVQDLGTSQHNTEGNNKSNDRTHDSPSVRQKKLQ